MKLLGFLLLVSALAALAAVRLHPPTREQARGLVLQGEKRDAFDAYQQGRAAFRAKWSGDPNAKFMAWGDDPEVSAETLRGDTWVAYGKVDFIVLGTPVRQPWLVGFNRRTGAAEFGGVGDEAQEAIENLRSGALRSAIKTPIAQTESAPVNPKSGSWMWQPGRTALDRRPRSSTYRSYSSSSSSLPAARPATTWSPSPGSSSGEWIEHDSRVSSMQAVGGGAARKR